MAIAKTVEGGENHSSAAHGSETFEFKLADGAVVICGKPQGVLKLRLRDVLPKEYLADAEMVTLATACLSIRSVDGAPLWLKSFNHLEAFINRFGGDDAVDEFMNKYNRLVNPKLMDTVDAAVKDAEEKGIHDPEKIKDFIAERVLKMSREQQERIQD